MRKRVSNRVTGYVFGIFDGETETDVRNAWARSLGYDSYARYLRDPALRGTEHLAFNDVESSP